MNFTAKNFRTEFPKLQNTDKELQKRFELMKKTKPEDYDNSETVKRGVDMFVMQLNQRYGDKIPASLPSEKSPKSKTKKEKKAKKEKQPKEKKEKQPKPKKEKPAYTGDYVEKIQPSVAYIKRYTHLHDKTVSEAKDSAIRLLSSLQKAIIEKVIRKTDTYADEVMKMQDNLIKLSEMRKSDIVINITNIEHLREIAKSEKVSDDVKIIKQFISIQGKEGVKEKAKSLLQKIMAIQKQSNLMVTMKMSLMSYLDGKTLTIEINSQDLAGLYGLAGIEFEIPKAGTSVQSTQFLGATFDTMNFTGKWGNFIGKPNQNFKIMVYGKAGGGKSTFALKFAYYLATTIGKRVLYVAREEKLGYTLQEKMLRLNIASSNLYVNETLPKNLSEYDVVFIDSVNTLGLEPSELERLPKNKAYVYIFQCTKDGKYRGSQEFEHDVDTVIEVANMTARMGKNRFGGKEREFKI